MSDRNEETIFRRAVEISDQDERNRFLDEACGDDLKLRADVLDLIAALADGSQFLKKPALGDTVENAPGLLEQIRAGGPSEAPGSMIGPYRLLEQIGEGGMGVVFLAEQHEPVRRHVALKIIKPGMDSKQVIARFEAERQALAMMNHPNIARVLDAGTTESKLPYFVMELVRGIPITDYCDQHKLTTNQRLELFVSVCEAIQHAHTKGIIHRDIKPSNVLIMLRDGLPVPKVIDFGVAKATNQQLTEGTLFTAFSQLVGTPIYMSPEQADGSALDIDTRSDIYSLGVLLYELLTGTTPLDRERMKAAAFDEVRKIIREEEPTKPSTKINTLIEDSIVVSANRRTDPARLRQRLRGELDWIVMRSLEKDRTRRYQTAVDFAADVRRHLSGEAVEACPPTFQYLLLKFARRHKVQVAFATLFLTMLCASSVVAWVLYSQAREASEVARFAEEQALAAKAEAEKQRDIAEQNYQQSEQRRRENETLAERLRGNLLQQYAFNLTRNAAAQQTDSLGALRLLEECPQDQRGWEWQFAEARNPIEESLVLTGSPISKLAVSPTQPKIVVIDKDDNLRAHRLSDGKKLWSISLRMKRPSAIFFSANGQRVGVASEFHSQPSEVLVIEMTTGRTVWSSVDESRRSGLAPRLSADGKRIAIPSLDKDQDGETRSYLSLLDIEQDVQLWSESCPGYPHAEFSPAGNRLYLSCLTGVQASDMRGRPSAHVTSTLACWDVEGPKEIWTRERNKSSLLIVSPDGRYLLTGDDAQIEVRSSESGEVIDSFEGSMFSGTFDSSGRHLLTRSDVVRLVDWEDRAELQVVQPSPGIAGGVGFTRGGRQLVSATGQSSRIDLYRSEPPQSPLVLQGHEGKVGRVAFSQDGRKLYSVGLWDKTLRVWDTKTGQELNVRRFDGLTVKCAPAGNLVATGGIEGVQVWNAETWEQVHHWREHWEGGRPWWIDFSDDGRRIAAGGLTGMIVAWDLQSTDTWYDTDGNATAHQNYENQGDGTAYVETWDPSENITRHTSYGRRDPETGERPITGRGWRNGGGPTELRDPDSSSGGWTPPWMDQPDDTLNSSDKLSVDRVLTDPEADWTGTYNAGEMLFDPEITLINPDPESGYQTQLNPNEAQTVPTSNPHNQVLPPDPNGP